MKRQSLFLMGLVLLFLSSCGTEQSGELVGVQDRPGWNGINPFGMVYVPSGTLTIGQSDQDVFSTYTQRPKSISISGFFMDDTEITNNEYRQYIHWIRDSIAHTILGDIEEDDFGNEKIIWDLDLDYNSEDLDEMFFEGDMKLSDSERAMDARHFTYEYK